MDRVRSSNYRIYFLAGERVLKHVHLSMERDRELNQLLNSGTEQFVAHVARLQQSIRTSQKVLTDRSAELAHYLARHLFESEPFSGNHKSDSNDPDRPQHVLIYHREDADAEFITKLANSFLDQMNTTTTIQSSYMAVFLAGPMAQGGAAVILADDGTRQSGLLQWAVDALDCKGGYNAKLKRWQDKARQQWTGVHSLCKRLGTDCVR
jgi:alanyl-tRNA synthetase